MNKQFFQKNLDVLLASCLILALVVLNIGCGEDSSVIVFANRFQNLLTGFIAAVVAHRYYRRRIQLDHSEFSRELFMNLNERYDQLNDKLEKIRASEIESYQNPGQIGTEDQLDMYFSEPNARSGYIAVVTDYLNLCAEEYFWFSEGYVEQRVWDCWLAGMKFWHSELITFATVVENERDRGTVFYNPDFLGLFPVRDRASQTNLPPPIL